MVIPSEIFVFATTFGITERSRKALCGRTSLGALEIKRQLRTASVRFLPLRTRRVAHPDRETAGKRILAGGHLHRTSRQVFSSRRSMESTRFFIFYLSFFLVKASLSFEVPSKVSLQKGAPAASFQSRDRRAPPFLLRPGTASGVADDAARRTEQTRNDFDPKEEQTIYVVESGAFAERSRKKNLNVEDASTSEAGGLGDACARLPLFHDWGTRWPLCVVWMRHRRKSGEPFQKERACLRCRPVTELGARHSSARLLPSLRVAKRLSVQLENIPAVPELLQRPSAVRFLCGAVPVVGKLRRKKRSNNVPDFSDLSVLTFHDALFVEHV